MTKQTSIYKKILQTQQAIGHVAKNGKNTFHKYDYATEADVLDAVKRAANEAGLVLLTATTATIGNLPDGKRFAHVVLSYKVVEAETGEMIEGTFDGYAEDNGDKAIYKATTGANKYFLMKFFGVATGDDPEKDEAKPPAADPETLKTNIRKFLQTHPAAKGSFQQLTGVAIEEVAGITDPAVLSGILNDLKRGAA